MKQVHLDNFLFLLENKVVLLNGILKGEKQNENWHWK